MAASQRLGRGFHRFGLFLAAALLVVGLLLMVNDVMHLRLWKVSLGELPVVVLGALIALVGLGLACLAVYGLVRAIGWVIGRFVG